MGRLRTQIGRLGSLVQTQVTELIYLYVPLTRLGGRVREDDATLLPMVAQDHLHKGIYIITLNKTDMHNMGCASVYLSVCLSVCLSVWPY